MTHPGILAQEKSQGQRSLAGYSPQDHKESFRDGKLDFFYLAAPGGRTQVKSNSSFIFGVLSRSLEDAVG